MAVRTLGRVRGQQHMCVDGCSPRLSGLRGSPAPGRNSRAQVTPALVPSLPPHLCVQNMKDDTDGLSTEQRYLVNDSSAAKPNRITLGVSTGSVNSAVVRCCSQGRQRGCEDP